MLPNGSLVQEFPAYAYRASENNETLGWYFGLPEGIYNTVITGRSTGTFRLLISGEAVGGQCLNYGDQPITKDAQAKITIGTSDHQPPLVLPDGKEVLPTIKEVPTPTPTKFKKCEGDQPYLYVEDRIMEKTVEIPIMMCNAKDLANMDLDWSFDASVLKIIDVTKGSLNKKALFDWNEVSAGKLKIAFASSKGDSAKKSSIAVMKFEVIGNTGATSTITGTVTTASKTDGTEISVSVNPGEFTVGTSQIKGDCDGDGELTGRDALAALQMSVGKRAIDMCYDYNKDGRVDSADAPLNYICYKIKKR
jgi:hypothetical protein